MIKLARSLWLITIRYHKRFQPEALTHTHLSCRKLSPSRLPSLDLRDNTVMLYFTKGLQD